jgi:hypothetical protein
MFFVIPNSHHGRMGKGKDLQHIDTGLKIVFNTFINTLPLITSNILTQYVNQPNKISTHTSFGLIININTITQSHIYKTTVHLIDPSFMQDRKQHTRVQ